jgi:hypothetical protein
MSKSQYRKQLKEEILTSMFAIGALLIGYCLLQAFIYFTN